MSSSSLCLTMDLKMTTAQVSELKFLKTKLDVFASITMKFVGEMIELNIHGTIKRERYISIYTVKAIIDLQPGSILRV